MEPNTITEKAERNARVGRLYYKALTDAAGYPNGMAFWEELSVNEKYHRTVTALSFLEYLVEEGAISKQQDIGVVGAYDEADCTALRKHFEEIAASEKQDLEDRIKALSGMTNPGKGSDNS